MTAPAGAAPKDSRRGGRCAGEDTAALCLSLACLRCGVWIDGSPGPASSPEQYWTPSMAQTTGYTRDDLRPLVEGLRTIHEEAADDTAATDLLHPRLVLCISLRTRHAGSLWTLAEPTGTQ